MRITLGSGGKVAGGSSASKTPLDTPRAVYEFWQEHIASDPTVEPDKENLVAVLLQENLRPMGYHLVSVGTLSSNVAHAREVFRSAVVTGSHGVILCHNHPSGDPTPSAADRDVTDILLQSAEVLQIRLMDHVVIGRPEEGRDGFCSVMGR